jgi:hypothetical protein
VVERITHFATRLALTLSLVAAAGGCVREADPLLCGDVGAGDLVITEVRGGPNLTDSAGQWIELYNAAGAAVDLHGVAVTTRSIGGNSSDRVLVRRPLTVAGGEYAVLGKFADGTQPAHVDYGWGTEPGIPRDGALTLTCGTTEIDQLAFTSLSDPSRIIDPAPPDPPPVNHGTYQLGEMPPTATGNDTAANWCADQTETLGTGNTKDYLGSPGEPNPGCTP